MRCRRRERLAPSRDPWSVYTRVPIPVLLVAAIWIRTGSNGTADDDIGATMSC
ncbi:DUF6653 family protein [Mycobacterium deserti]|uniref:DUF6653 family protein n=1 Tax=Mycobacterium deserti TaxID=2978347 RepID=UPI0036F2D8F7